MIKKIMSTDISYDMHMFYTHIEKSKELTSYEDSKWPR